MAKHAAILIRVSTDAQKQHGTSLPQQKSDLLRLAKSLGYAVTKNHIYDDGGYSGSQLTHSERPGLSELVKAAERKEFEVAFVQYIDRFGRTTLENLITRNKLKQLGVVIHSYYEGRMENEPAGDLLFMFHSWKAEADNEQRKERSINGRIRATRNGKHCMGGPPYGYDRDFRTKKLHVNRKGEWVRKFYRWCALDELSLREICRRANQLRVPLPGRRRKHHVWHRSSIHGILTNPAYAGRVVFRRFDRDGHERPREEWIELSIPPLISEQTFEQTQKKLRENKEKALRNTKRTYLYGGVIYCGYCKHRLGSGFQPARHEGIGTRYYHGLDRCEISVGRCTHCPQVAEARLTPVWDAIRDAVTDPEYLHAKVAEYSSSDKTRTKERLTEVGRQISTVAHQRKRILNAYVHDDKMDQKEYLHLVHSLDAESLRLTQEKGDIERLLLNKHEQIRLSEEISHTYKQIRQRVTDASYEARRAIVRKVVNRIFVYDKQGEAEIELNLAPAKGETRLPFEYGTVVADKRDENPSFVSSDSATTGHKWEPFGVRIRVPIWPARPTGRKEPVAA